MLEYNVGKLTGRYLFLQQFILCLQHLHHVWADLLGDAFSHGKIRLKIDRVFDACHDTHLNVVKQLFNSTEKLRYIYSDGLCDCKRLNLS